MYIFRTLPIPSTTTSSTRLQPNKVFFFSSVLLLRLLTLFLVPFSCILPFCFVLTFLARRSSPSDPTFSLPSHFSVHIYIRSFGILHRRRRRLCIIHRLLLLLLLVTTTTLSSLYTTFSIWQSYHLLSTGFSKQTLFFLFSFSCKTETFISCVCPEERK